MHWFEANMPESSIIMYIYISFKPYLINQLTMIFGLVLSFPSHFAWINPSIFDGLEHNHGMTIPMNFLSYDPTEEHPMAGGFTSHRTSW